MTTFSVIGRWARGELDLAPADNPAKYSTEVLVAIDKAITDESDRLGRRLMILDPMAGVGRIHRMGEAGHHVVAAELEPEWALHKQGPTVVADARAQPYRPGCFDVLASSPVYGNRMRDAHEAKDLCKHTVNQKGGAPPKVYGLADCPKCKGSGLTPRNTYRHKLGRVASVGSTTPIGWGVRYQRAHEPIAAESMRMLRPGGLIVWNTSNFYVTVGEGDEKREVEQHVNEWWINLWMTLGCTVQRIERPQTRRQKFGANRNRIEGELVSLLRAPGMAA